MGKGCKSAGRTAAYRTEFNQNDRASPSQAQRRESQCLQDKKGTRGHDETSETRAIDEHLPVRGGTIAGAGRRGGISRDADAGREQAGGADRDRNGGDGG